MAGECPIFTERISIQKYSDKDAWDAAVGAKLAAKELAEEDSDKEEKGCSKK